MLTEREEEIFQSLLDMAPDTFKGKLYRDGVPRPDIYLRNKSALCLFSASRISETIPTTSTCVRKFAIPSSARCVTVIIASRQRDEVGGTGKVIGYRVS